MLQKQLLHQQSRRSSPKIIGTSAREHRFQDEWLKKWPRIAKIESAASPPPPSPCIHWTCPPFFILRGGETPPLFQNQLWSLNICLSEVAHVSLNICLSEVAEDTTVRIWDTFSGRYSVILTAHSATVQCVKWGGTDLYTASSDRTIKVWRSDGVLCRSLEAHAHWVNTLSVNTDYVMRTGAFDPSEAKLVKSDVTDSSEELARKAKARYDAFRQGAESELLVSGSDDTKVILWRPEVDKKPVKRMDGHGQTVVDVKFSPDGRMIASASFDHSVRLWHGKTGAFIATLRGHVQDVYQLCWSADSRLLVSGSKDSTLKLWDVAKGKSACDLPGHADAVYAVDWSPDGQRVVSGGKDRVLKMWRA